MLFGKENSSKRSQEIDAELKLQQKKQNSFIKIVLLGSGNSGKSTILKQMRILHGAPFSHQERVHFKSLILQNIIDSIQLVIANMSALNISLSSNSITFYMNQVSSFKFTDCIPLYIVNAIQVLWHDQGIQTCVSTGNKFKFQETSKYYLDHLKNYIDPEYIVSDLDILNVRAPTTSITSTTFKIDGLCYNIFDMGGQKSLRVYWAAHFDDLDAILYVASLDCYNRIENDENQMTDSINLFKLLCDNSLLKSCNVILFLNKVDLFAKLIKVDKVDLYFSDYDYTNENTQLSLFKYSSRFFKLKFLASNVESRRSVYTHYTTATNTQNMKAVIDSVRDIIMRFALQSKGIF